MEIYDTRYFTVNKTMMKKVGLWPYERSVIKKLFLRVTIGLYIIIGSLPQIYGLHKNFGVHMDKIIEHLALLCYMYGIFLKLVSTVLAEKKLSRLYKSIAENWQSIKNNEEERHILIQYSERGRFLTIGYITYMMMALLFFITLPITPIFLNIIMPLNESRPRDFILHGEFPVDQEAFYIEIFLFDAAVCIVTVALFSSVDSMYTVCVEHSLALFAIVKSRLEKCTKSIVKPAKSQQGDVPFHMIVETIKLHEKILRFTELLESSYSNSFLLLMGMNLIYCSLVSALLIIRRDEIMERIRWTSILGGLLIHLFYVSWPGQKLIDYSGGLFEDTYLNEWYEISIKAQNLLRFMKLRCLNPCQLTAGGLYVMNFSNFASIIKSSMSYITVFASFT